MNGNSFNIELMNKTSFIQYLDRITDGASRRSIAEKAGIPPSTFVGTMRKVEDGLKKVPMENIVDICKAYGTPLLPAVAAAGYITEQEAENIVLGVDVALSKISDEELGEEVLRRLKSGSSHKVLEEPLNEESNIVQLHAENSIGGITEHDDVLSDEKKVARKRGRNKLGDDTAQ